MISLGWICPWFMLDRSLWFWFSSWITWGHLQTCPQNQTFHYPVLIHQLRMSLSPEFKTEMSPWFCLVRANRWKLHHTMTVLFKATVRLKHSLREAADGPDEPPFLWNIKQKIVRVGSAELIDFELKCSGPHTERLVLNPYSKEEKGKKCHGILNQISFCKFGYT